MAQTVKNLPVMQEVWVQSLGQDDPQEKEMATPSSISAWRISWTGSLADYSPWGPKEPDITELLKHDVVNTIFNFSLKLNCREK